MLKRLLFLSFVAMTSQASAQITITNADAPRASYYFVEATMDSTVAANLAIGTAGTNRTWNFSTIRRATGSTDQTTYVRAVNAQMPQISRFPLATHVTINNSGRHEYLQVTNTVLANLGDADLNGDYSRFGKPLRQLLYPTAYGTTFGDTTKRYDYEAASGAIDSSTTFRSVTTADAWGSITTPLGTFNALRTTTVLTTSVVILGTTLTGTSTIHAWSANGYATPLVTRIRTLFPAAGVDDVDATYLVRRTVATEDFGATVANAYPNPTMKGINLDFSVEKAQQISFQVTNLIGQTVVSEQPNFFAQGSHTQYIALDGLANGLYMLNVLNEKNEIISAKKIMMQR
jgi:hypothetical protein